MRLLPLLFFLSCISPAQAQDTISTKQIDEIIIKEKRHAAQERAEFKALAQTVEVLSLSEINRNNPAFLDQSLNTMAGVQVDKRTQLGGQRMVIRGYGNDQKFNNWGIKAYLNGMPLTTAEGVTILDDIDFATLNRIAIIKGPAATLYGGGVGGVARFDMATETQKGTWLTKKTTAGSFGLFQTNTKLDVVTDRAAMAVNFGHLESDGYRPRGYSLKNFGNFFGEFQLSDKQKLTAYLSHNYSNEGVTGQIPYADYYAGIDNGNIAYTKKNARNELLTTRASIAHQYTFNAHVSNQTSVFYSNQDFTRVAAGASEMSMNPNFGLRSTFNIKTDLNDKIGYELIVGTELQQSRSLISNFRFVGNDDNVPLKVQDLSKGGSYFRYITTQQSFFAQNHLNIKSLDAMMVVGISANKLGYSRLDMLALPALITGYNKDLSYEKTFKTSFNPHIALQKSYKEHVFNLSYSEGYNAPTATTAFVGTINKVNDDLLPEKAKMIELSAQGLLLNNRLDYQASVFTIDISNKLTQLSGALATGGTYSYFANTGTQQNRGIELSLGYLLVTSVKGFIKKIEPFANYSNYNFTYKDFKTRFGSGVVDYSGKQVIGVPPTKYTLGLDIDTHKGLYLNNTYNYMGAVYTDFANSSQVKAYSLLNSKVGYRFANQKIELDVYVAGNNLTNQVHYTFLFLGNNVNDSDVGSNYPAGLVTDVNPGPSKAYYFGGINLKIKLGGK